MIAATCHCGAVRVSVPRRPRTLTNCNCSICRRYGTLWAYYEADSVRVDTGPQALQRYAWGDRHLWFVRCAHCGCVTHWEPVRRSVRSHVGVNMRNFAPEAIGSPTIRRLDGAASWKFVD